MKIETNFSVGDTAYFLYNNKIVSEKVYKLYIEKEGENDLIVSYGFKFANNDYIIMFEGNCYVSKEELIKSL